MNDPAFLFYPGDYLRDTQCLSESVQVAYDRIMCEHMRNICISQSQLNFFTKRLSADEKEELDMVLTKVDGGFQIQWIAESIIKRKAYSESRRNNRTSKPKKTSSTYDLHMENEIEIEIEDISEAENKKKKLKIPKIQNDNFEVFWDLYSKKADTAKCKAKFKTLKPDEVKKILTVVSDYVESTPDPKYRKNPITWLNGKCWNDEIIINKNQNGNNTNDKSKTDADHKQSAVDAVNAMFGIQQ